MNPDLRGNLRLDEAEVEATGSDAAA